MDKRALPFYFEITDDMIVDHGISRIVCLVENFPDLVLKARGAGEYFQSGKRYKRWLNKYFPSTKYRFMICEIKHEEKISKRAKRKGIRSPIAPIIKMVNTNYGPAILTKRIGPESGKLGPTLETYPGRGKFDQEKINSLTEFARSFFRLGVVASDIRSKNIVWGTEEGKMVPYIVDGFGDRNIVPFKSMFFWLRNKALHIGMHRTACEAGLEWSVEERKFYQVLDLKPERKTR